MIAIIPARGGSKGLPGKNIKLLNGIPLIAYTIKAAINAKAVTRVIVSTDSEEIADVSGKFGAEVPFMRPDHLASDTSAAIDTYLYTIQELERTENISINEIMILLPTSPLRTAEDINKAVELFKGKNADSVISYTEEHHPISWHKYLNDQLKFEDIFPPNIKNRQELKTSYYPNGSIYIFKKTILVQGIYYSENSYAHLMPRNRSVDIDSMEDFEYAEFLIKKGY